MMPVKLYTELNKLRDEYRKNMNSAADAATDAAAREEMGEVSVYSTESERMREAFHALNLAIQIVETFFEDGSGE